MKRTIYKILYLLLITLMAGNLFARDVILVNGYVYDIDNGKPVAGQAVIAYSSDFSVFLPMTTDMNGYFGDSLFLSGNTADTLFVETLDCNQVPHTQVFTGISSSVYAEFEICIPNFPPGCEAYFNVLSIWPDSLTVQFVDMSVGYIEEWLWDFGDSTYSAEQHPVHTFPATGTYTVCLSIFNYDSLMPCLDFYCEEITIIDSVSSCQAVFTYMPNPMPSSPNTFHFTDLSQGNVDQWLWEFGDGQTSEEQHPVHQYAEEGTYQVCLTVYNTSNPGLCWDNSCQVLSTPGYSYFGGQVFAGEYPLNNPASTGDTGVAYLYYVSQGELWPIDTNIFFNEMGLYAFNNLMTGEYIVKVGLTATSAHHDDYFPVYYQQQLTWNDAEPIVLNTALYDANVFLVPTVTLPGGPGKISGYVSFLDGPASSPSGMNAVEVILYDQDETPLTYTLSGPDGYFEFTGLPYGIYKVLADEAGYFTEQVSFGLDENLPLVDTLQLLLYRSPTFGIGENEPASLSVSDPYPNPATDNISFSVELLERSSLYVVVTDLTGRIHYLIQYEMAAGQHKIKLPVVSLARGIYLVSVRQSSTSLNITRKFIK